MQQLHKTGDRTCLIEMEQALQVKGQNAADKGETAQAPNQRENPRMVTDREKGKDEEDRIQQSTKLPCREGRSAPPCMKPLSLQPEKSTPMRPAVLRRKSNPKSFDFSKECALVQA
jgi:hypothetical protein